MNRRPLSLALLAGIACCIPLGAFSEEVSDISIALVPYCGANGFNILGPMAIIVHISNRGAGKVTLVDDYADGSGIEVKMTGVDCEPVSIAMAHRTMPRHLLVINPNSEFNYPLYLTNMYRFASPGNAQATWSAKIHVIIDDATQIVASAGGFSVRLRDGNREELDRELSRLLDFAMNIEDIPARMGKVEGICSIRDPMVIPFLQRLLNVKGGELRSLETLVGVWGNDPRAGRIIDNFIETTDDAAKLQQVIGMLLERHRMLSEAQLSRLLKSKDDGIRFCGINYMHELLDSLHLAESIPPLSRDTNMGIHGQCDDILRALSDALGKNESKTFQKQEAARSSANGF